MAEDSEVDAKSSPNTLSPPKSPTSNGGSGDFLTIDNGWGGRLSRRSSLRASITSIDSAAPTLKKDHFHRQVTFFVISYRAK